MATISGFSWSVHWGNPYTDPPGGLEYSQIEEKVYNKSSSYVPAAVLAKWHTFGLGSGWALSCSPLQEPPKRKLSENQKRSMRRTKLYNRLLKSDPLFAEQFYDEKIATKPEYYGCTGRTAPYPRPKPKTKKGAR